MKTQFVPYEQALALKELGFNQRCLGQYNTHQGDKWIFSIDLSNEGQYPTTSPACIAPLYQQAFKFFREKHNLLGNVYSNASGWLWEIHDNIGGTHRFGSEYSGDCEESGMFTSFDKAEQECLIKLIEIVKQQK